MQDHESLLAELIATKNALEEAQALGKIGNWSVDVATGKVSWSKELFSLHRVPPEAGPPSPEAVMQILHPDDRQKVLDTSMRCLNEGTPFRLVYRLAFPDRTVWLEGRGRARKNASGQVVEMLGTAQDVTDFTLAEQELSAQKGLLDVVLENLPIMVFVKDYSQELRFKLFNKAGQSLIGVDKQNILGKNDYDLFTKEQADFFTSVDREVFRSGQARHVSQEPIQTPQGERWLRTYKVPTYRADGSPDLLIGISTDITDELAMQKTIEIERAKALHNAKLASLGELSAGIAHEINNPLAIISGNVHILKELGQGSDPKVEAIGKAVERIQKIVTGLRKFARSTGGKPHKREPLQELVAESLVFTEAKAKKHGVQVTFCLEEGLEVLCDGVEIEQVLVNLVNNGIDAVKRLQERWVRVCGFAENGQVILQVKDSGTGIPQEIEAKLFQPFFTTKDVGEGTGLGLSIAKGILDEHNASFGLNQSIGNTCFEIRFPAP